LAMPRQQLIEVVIKDTDLHVWLHHLGALKNSPFEKIKFKQVCGARRGQLMPTTPYSICLSG
jgi:hypothetical protein